MSSSSSSTSPASTHSSNRTSVVHPTAAILVIGNEILSGRTQDINLAYMAKGLAGHGIRVGEARIIPDIEAVIVNTLNELRASNTYVFTTGGIGPTHDDITADCVALAFDVDIGIHPDASARLMSYWSERNIEPNDDRLRMARIPDGATLIDNPISVAPGFRLQNVHVMAGVPRIMQAMFDSILPGLQRGAVIDSVSVMCDLGEGTIASPLRALQQQFPDIDLGSYPGRMPVGDGEKFTVNLVARGTDEKQLQVVKQALVDLVGNANGNIIDA